MPNKIRLVIVDDSLFMRKMLQQMFGEDLAIEVVGMASNGQEAIEKVKELRPDAITMDVNMPIMEGPEALRIIMRECPTRALMLSCITRDGAEATLDSLAAGAVDFLTKPAAKRPEDLGEFKKILFEKIHAVARSPLQRPVLAAPLPKGEVVKVTRPPVPAAKVVASGKKEVLVIGTSTGGPNALQVLIPQLPGDLPVGVLIVQHMPPTFTGQLAQRLDRLSALKVKEAEEGDVIRPGEVLLAPGHSHLVVRQRGQVGLDQEPANLPHRPAVDVMIASAARVYGASAVGVIMTGMGQDGKEGMKELKAKGGTILAQDEKSCVVYGMPKAVVEAGLADQVCALEDLAPAVVHALN